MIENHLTMFLHIWYIQRPFNSLKNAERISNLACVEFYYTIVRRYLYWTMNKISFRARNKIGHYSNLNLIVIITPHRFFFLSNFTLCIQFLLFRLNRWYLFPFCAVVPFKFRYGILRLEINNTMALGFNGVVFFVSRLYLGYVNQHILFCREIYRTIKTRQFIIVYCKWHISHINYNLWYLNTLIRKYLQHNICLTSIGGDVTPLCQSYISLYSII